MPVKEAIISADLCEEFKKVLQSLDIPIQIFSGLVTERQVGACLRLSPTT